jgi:BioD-like phosphotransacetylase family protein
VVLTLGIVPPAGLIKLMKQRKIPFISTDRDSYEVVSIINRMTIKTEPGDHQKIDLIQNLFEEHIDVEHIIESAGMPDETGELPFE